MCLSSVYDFFKTDLIFVSVMIYFVTVLISVNYNNLVQFSSQRITSVRNGAVQLFVKILRKHRTGTPFNQFKLVCNEPLIVQFGFVELL
jgi:hypothetical protein